MQAIEKIIDSRSGYPVNLLIRIPDTTPKGVVQINTGTCIPQKVYWRFAEFLAHNGYITITYDYTDAQNFSSSVTHVEWVRDMESVFDFVMNEYPGLKKIVVGHSSGGQLIGMMYNAPKIDRIYLVASANGYWKLMDGPLKYGMWFFWHVVVPINLKLFGYFNNKVLGGGGGFPKNIILELKSFCLQNDFFLPYFKSKGFSMQYDMVRSRLVSYQLEGDVIANETACRYITGLYENADSNFIILKGPDHGVKRFGHRSFFSNQFPEIWKGFLSDLEIF